jgi:phage terminase large subunit GpA-like protein
MLDGYSFADPADIAASVTDLFKPPPKLTVTEWADKERFLSAESAATPGRYKSAITPYMREPMNMVGKPGVQRITLMTSAQVAKSTVIENVIGYFIHHDPCPILHVSPTLESMKMFSKERLAPMLRDTPALVGLVKEARSRDSGNTLNSKVFPGGHIAMVGANAPSGLASRPIRVLVADEVDRFEQSAGTEGDPISLAVKRTTTFWNRVLVFVSTPGDKGTSRIEPEFLRGDQRYYHVPCPHCGEKQRLVWGQVKWEEGNPQTAYYECEHNGCVLDDQDRKSALIDGEWIATQPFNGNVSYHLSQLYSPFAPLADGVRDFLAAKDNPQELKTWINTFLGETWEEKGKRLDWSDLLDQREEYPEDHIPEGVTLVTAGIDVQDDRFELEFVGWGDDFRSWSLGYHKIYGDPSAPDVWNELRSILNQTFMHPLFGEMAWRAACIDSGGHYTQAVYEFAASIPRLLAIKGVEGFGKPIFGSRLKNTISGMEGYQVGVDNAKQDVVARLKVGNPDKAGYCAFPMHYDESYFQGLTAEELRTTFSRGFPVLRWQKIRTRNEPFDCRVYSRAALEFLSVDLNAQRRAASWVNSWKE